MRVVKYTHSCVRLEKGDGALVIDPGGFSEAVSLDGAAAVLITHEHPDHLDPDKLRARPELPVWTNPAVAERLVELLPEHRVHAVDSGDRFDVAGFDVAVRGEWHEPIHPDIPLVRNVGFRVDGVFFHPGDAFHDPGADLRVLMVPTTAPWMRAATAVDYARSVRPTLAVATHEGTLNADGHAVVDRLLASLLGTTGPEYRRLATGDAVEI